MPCHADYAYYAITAIRDKLPPRARCFDADADAATRGHATVTDEYYWLLSMMRCDDVDER